VSSGVGHLEAELCKFFSVTPRQLGDLRKDDPLGVAFIERHLIYKAEQIAKESKKMKKKKPGKRI